MKKLVLGTILLSMSLFATEGSNLYKKCAGCHGINAEKAALGKSKILKDMSKEDIEVALKGYKDGSYGGPMKGIMKGQVMSFTDEDITTLAQFLSEKE